VTQPGTEFVVTVLPYFEADNPTVVVYSYDDSLNLIDVSNQKSVEYN